MLLYSSARGAPTPGAERDRHGRPRDHAADARPRVLRLPPLRRRPARPRRVASTGGLMHGRDPARGADEGVRRARRGRRHRPRHARRRVLHAARPVGLRQDDDAAHDRRLRAARRAGGSCSTASTSRASRRTSATSTRSSRATRCSRTSTWPKNVAFGLKYQKLSKEERAKRVGEALELVQPDRVREAQGRPALGRPAAARRARARARAAAARAAARRAARRARRPPAQEPPGRAEDAPVGPRRSRSCSSRTTRRRRSR